MAQDTVGHEFTHGVTTSSMMGLVYYNESGAINEAYSDIMGNLVEMATGATSDKDWLINETTGETMRNMGDPNEFQQPAFIGDVYYLSPVNKRDNRINDLGGVHINNTLLSSLAYSLDRAGMSYDEQTRLWLTTIQFITPLSDYDDIHCALLFSLVNNGMESYESVINDYFQQAGMNAIRSQSYLESTKAGCGRFYMTADAAISSMAVRVTIYSEDGQAFSQVCPDENGIITTLLPAGYYAANLYILQGNGDIDLYRLTKDGWRSEGNNGWFEIIEGETTKVKGITAGGSEDSGKTDTESNENNHDEKPSSDETELKLTQYDGGDFTCLVPETWKIIRKFLSLTPACL